MFHACTDHGPTLACRLVSKLVASPHRWRAVAWVPRGRSLISLLEIKQAWQKIKQKKGTAALISLLFEMKSQGKK
jgi:hypothetical protein